MEHRNLVLRLTFAERLCYCADSGFRTPKTTFPFSVLDDLMAGIERMAADAVEIEPVSNGNRVKYRETVRLGPSNTG
jgi:hypothetical protein